MNAQGTVELQYHAFLASGLEGDERSDSRPSLFTLRERVPVKALKKLVPKKELDRLTKLLPGDYRTCPQNSNTRLHLSVRNGIFELRFQRGNVNSVFKCDTS